MEDCDSVVGGVIFKASTSIVGVAGEDEEAVGEINGVE